MSINKPAIGIHIIQRDKPGSFPRILANLSGIEFKQADCTQDHKKPSFHYSRYQNCTYGKKQDENYFYYTADITLEEPKNVIADVKDAIGAVVLSLPSPDSSSKERDKKIQAMNSLLFNFDRLGSIKIPNGKYIKLEKDPNDIIKYNVKNEEYINELFRNCIFQVTTSPETYRAELFNLLKNWDFYGDPEFKKEKAKKEIERAYIDTTFSYSEEIPTGSPLAKLYLCCRYGNKPGTLAAAINTLLFNEFERFQNKERIFNIMFYIDYFSFASGIAYDAIYGNLEYYSKRIDEGQLKNVIERILICPITKDQSWREYAKNLVNFLNNKECKINSKNGENKYIMKPENTINDQNIPNILIYRNNKSPCEICEIKEDGELRPELRPNKGCDICRKYWWPPTGLNPQFRSRSV